MVESNPATKGTWGGRAGDVPAGQAADAGADTLAFQMVGADVPPSAGVAAEKRSHAWPWVVLAVALIALVGAGAGGWWYFRSRTLPGVTLWGNPVTGRTQAQIADAIDSQVDSATVTVNHDGKSVDVKLSDLGLDVDSDDIARQAFEAKRTDSVLSRYLPWNHVDVAPELVNAAAADGAGLDAALGTGDQEPVDAQVNLNADGTGFDVAAAQTGNGADTQPVAEALVKSIESLGTAKGGSQEAVIKSIQPAVTDDIANQAKVTLDKYLATPIAIKVNDRDIATIDAKALASSMSVEANENSKLTDAQWRDGYVVFDADKLQQYYESSIKPNLKTGREDRQTVVNNNGDVLQTISEGHDGVTIDDGADSSIGASVVQAMEKGQSSVTVAGKVDKMQDKTVKRHVVVDLSDGKVYAYENDKLIKAMNMSAGEGTVRGVGTCAGDLCTPTGDFTIWLKYPSQDMSGNLTLSDGSNSTWDVKDVGYVNYFSKSGCAIHRIVSQMTDAEIGAMNANTSHGCVGIGWDVAEWFYGWCLDGTSVHVQE